LKMPLLCNTTLPLYPLHLTMKKGRIAPAPDRKLLQAAKNADAVLFFGGLNHNDDIEGGDRKNMQLYGGQNQLISQLAEVNRNLAVILVGGSPVEMPWINQVPAILQMWYAGQEGGRAVARILFGLVNPSRKLPVTFPRTYSESPVGCNGDYSAEVCNYREGVLVGYRWFDAKKVKPLFPFGHGLSYTTFSLGHGLLEKPSKGKVAACSFVLKNTGKRAGREVVQLYIEPPKVKGIIRPVRELKEFAKCALAPGESCRVLFQLDARDFSYYDAIEHQWVIAPGLYKLRAGTSSAALTKGIPLRLK